MNGLQITWSNFNRQLDEYDAGKLQYATFCTVLVAADDASDDPSHIRVGISIDLLSTIGIIMPHAGPIGMYDPQKSFLGP